MKTENLIGMESFIAVGVIFKITKTNMLGKHLSLVKTESGFSVCKKQMHRSKNFAQLSGFQFSKECKEKEPSFAMPSYLFGIEKLSFRGLKLSKKS